MQNRNVSRIHSLGWARTSDLPVNSRALCQLSYEGLYDGNCSTTIGYLYQRAVSWASWGVPRLSQAVLLNVRMFDGGGSAVLAAG